MSIVTARYANALYEATINEVKDDKVESDVKILYGLVSQNKKIYDLLKNPKKKNQVIEKITHGMSPLVVNFCMVLAQNNRLNLLASIAQEFLQLLKQNRNEIDIKVTSTMPLTKNHLEQIKKSLNIKHKICIINHVDKSILGGIIIQHGRKMLDLSSKTKLKALQQISKEGVLTCN